MRSSFRKRADDLPFPAERDAPHELHRFEQRGFSLLELMVTLAVGSLLLSVAVPSFTTVVKNANIVSTANDLLADLHFTRALAITRNQRIVMCPSDSGSACDSTDWAEGWLVFADDDGDGVLDAGEPVEHIAEGLSRLALQTKQFGAAITYRPNGRAMGSDVTVNFGAFLLCDDRGSDHARAIIVDYSGKPQVVHLAEMGATATCPAI